MCVTILFICLYVLYSSVARLNKLEEFSQIVGKQESMQAGSNSSSADNLLKSKSEGPSYRKPREASCLTIYSVPKDPINISPCQLTSFADTCSSFKHAGNILQSTTG